MVDTAGQARETDSSHVHRLASVNITVVCTIMTASSIAFYFSVEYETGIGLL